MHKSDCRTRFRVIEQLLGTRAEQSGSGYTVKGRTSHLGDGTWKDKRGVDFEVVLSLMSAVGMFRQLSKIPSAHGHIHKVSPRH